MKNFYRLLMACISCAMIQNFTIETKPKESSQDHAPNQSSKEQQEKVLKELIEKRDTATTLFNDAQKAYYFDSDPDNFNPKADMARYQAVIEQSSEQIEKLKKTLIPDSSQVDKATSTEEDPKKDTPKIASKPNRHDDASEKEQKMSQRISAKKIKAD